MSKENIIRTLQRALLVLVLTLVCIHEAWAQNNQNSSAGSGGAYDASVCDDPTIAINAQQQNATPYRDSTPTGQQDPLWAALYDLAQKYDDSNIDEAGVCLHASGVVFMVPTDRVGELTQLLGEIEASEPGGDTYSASDNNGSGGQPSGGTVPNPVPVTGGSPPNDTDPMPGPAGGIGWVPGPNPCINQSGSYNYCNNGPGARLPAGCTCNGSAPSGEKSLNRESGPQKPTQTQSKPPAPAPTHPTLLAIYKKMNDCLRAKLPYMPAFTPQDPYMTKALVAAEGSVAPSTPIDQVPFRSQVFILETAAALQAQAYHDQVYGPSKTDPNPTDAKDYLVGWFDRCVADAGIVPETTNLSPDNPPNAYAAFLGPGNQHSRLLKFISGYGTEMLAPTSLIPPWKPPPEPTTPAH